MAGFEKSIQENKSTKRDIALKTAGAATLHDASLPMLGFVRDPAYNPMLRSLPDAIKPINCLVVPTLPI